MTTAAPAPNARRAPRWRALFGALAIGACSCGTPRETPPAAQRTSSSITRYNIASRALGGTLTYQVFLPAGYAASTRRYPVVYLLHGRGDTLSAWDRSQALFDELIAAGTIPPLIAVMPDAPSSRRGGYWVDSDYRGPDLPGAKVETAFIAELIPHLDATLRTVNDRTARFIAGYSMGGYGALRYALAYPELFGGAIVLSPAVYTPLPPAGSSTREFGAFGRGSTPFVDEIYRAKNYPALLPAFAAKKLPLRLFIAAGDDEYKNPDPADAMHDIDVEAHLLFNRAARVPNISAELRILDGGHDWDVWQRALREALPRMSPASTLNKN
ncbi:MAG TPA: alpha/beta fold hydrolase [Burkholderiaceae bacterium]|nr:alpha/beta fold hydrolase [Burkholderiaceae bacterium]